MASPHIRASGALALVLVLASYTGGAPEPDPGPTRAPVAARDTPADTPRIVSLIPAASAFLAELGAAHAVVGRSADDRTRGLEDVPEVGRVLSPDLESVVSLRPTAIVAWADGDLGPLRRAAELSGARLVPLRFDRLEDIAGALPPLAELVDREARARRLLADTRRRLDSLKAARSGPASGVLWVVWTSPPIVAGAGTLPADLLEVVGARNAAAHLPVAWPRPSYEWLVAQDPDVVVWPVGPGHPPLGDLPEDSPWRALPAVRQGRVAELDADLVHEAGPRVVEAAAALDRALARALAQALDSPDSPPHPTRHP